MNNLIDKMSFRSKILSVLLFITVLLSGLSFILVYSIDDVNEISNQLKDEDIPEIIWLSYWEEELHIKQYIVENSLADNLCCEFVKEYEQSDQSFNKDHQIQNTPMPESLQSLQERIELLDFKVSNNVDGLLRYGDTKAAKRYIENEYLPELESIQEAIAEVKKETSHSVDSLSDKLPLIIKNSLILLLLLMIIAVIISIVASYKMSASLTKPIEKMVDKVDRIAYGEYGLTIDGTKQVELQRLITSINAMSYNLYHSFHQIVTDKVYREQILNSLPVGIITIDDETSHVFLNRAAKRLLNADDQTVQEFIKNQPAHNERFWQIVGSSKTCDNRKVFFESEETEYCLLVSQSQLVNHEDQVIGRILHFVDITDAEKLEQRMHQSEKLALVGELAAGAAHEIRNPLAVIHGFVSLMNQSFSDQEKSTFHLELLLKELERINLIIEEMLMLAKPGAPIMREIMIEDVINEILPLIKHTYHNQLTVSVEMEPRTVWVDEKQMKQVFHNLLRNSIEAMNGEGEISISSDIIEDMYCIYIKDKGEGIPQSLQTSVFHPFATSKENGTGLGLTIVQKILENHQGHIELLSTSSKGTTFVIKIPLHHK
ncbi:HAMP domain-containing protein [Priestia megaterium]|nr:HAMP domain-containing protein [Priestia megaterium]